MIKTSGKFYQELLSKFDHIPTDVQNELFIKLSEFIFDQNKNGIFMVKGYAGTGKTTTISALVNSLWKAGLKSVLLAPTGRAAKVMGNYSKRQAFTIHKKIYFPKKDTKGGLNFVIQKNKHTNTIFIVDEASMISDASSEAKLFENGSVLDDLLQYVYSGKNCKVIFVGDTAQLPPVKLELSPALKSDLIEMHFNKDVTEIELDEVTRQHQQSGILANATELRLKIQDEYFSDFKFQLGYDDLIRLNDGDEILDAFMNSYDSSGVEDTVLIVRSNKRANLYNQQIRSRILGRDEQLTTGDYIMVVKNNYHWLKDSNNVSFIANGDICEIMRIHKFINLYGFEFAEVQLRLIDYPDQDPFDTVVILDVLKSETPSLSYEEGNKLYQEVGKDYADLKSKYKIMLAIKNNKYFNALQIKYSYAMTCHKSQGGQWKNVFIEKPYLPDGQNLPYLRWLYTAVTRAQEKLYLIGFNKDCIDEN